MTVALPRFARVCPMLHICAFLDAGMLFFQPQPLNWYLYCGSLHNPSAVSDPDLRHLNLLGVKAVLLFHDLHNLGQFELLLEVVTIQIRLEQLPSLFEWNIGTEYSKWSRNKIHWSGVDDGIQKIAMPRFRDCEECEAVDGAGRSSTITSRTLLLNQQIIFRQDVGLVVVECLRITIKMRRCRGLGDCIALGKQRYALFGSCEPCRTVCT
jgi:hypothetical protein